MSPLVIDTNDEAGTERLGKLLAEALPAGSVVALCGTLGAGKTRLVQALAAASGIAREEVVSPTFVLVQQYQGARTIHHLDAYRLRDEDEFRELGVEELFASDGVTLIEWADRVADAMPDEYLRIDIEVTGPTSRRFTLSPIGERYERALSNLQLQ